MPTSPLFAPREFFTKRSPSFVGAAVILILTFSLALGRAAMYGVQLTSVKPSIERLLLLILLGGVIGAAGIWIVATAVVYILTAVVGGSGSLTRVAVNIGWAFLPLLVTNTISTIAVLSFVYFGDLSTLTSPLLRLPLWALLFNVITSVVGYCWIGYLLTYAIHDARELDIRHSALIAGILVILQIIYTVVVFL